MSTNANSASTKMKTENVTTLHFKKSSGRSTKQKLAYCMAVLILIFSGAQAQNPEILANNVNASDIIVDPGSIYWADLYTFMQFNNPSSTEK
jgi:hypothetical protein